MRMEEILECFVQLKMCVFVCVCVCACACACVCVCNLSPCKTCSNAIPSGVYVTMSLCL